jgi:serine phosphatase RsbU (regulator of sigma subunit)
MRAVLAELEAQCVAPIVDRQERLVGLIVLGARRSAERYRDEDVGWLVSIAGDAGLAVEVLQRAERLATRMADERREHQEIAIASDVQRRLFPQRVPELGQVALAARCIQARAIGGDYYDFLDLGPGRVGLVLADVSGKGVHAALRMANLQAHLRSQAGSTPQDPLRVMRETNRLLYESTKATDFATVFLGVLAAPSRRLTYVNCGHNPPLCVRGDGTAEWLGATATVLGAFEPWECALGRTQLGRDDTLIVYSDGVTEAGRDGRHFGEQRLLDLVRTRPGATPEELVSLILESVQAYGDEEQIDDLTVIVAQGR